MRIYEHQAMERLRGAGIAVPGGMVVEGAGEAAEAFKTLAASGAKAAVVKAQVHAGGRGKGGGVKLVRSAEEARQAAEGMMSKPLVTPQTGPAGVAVRKVLVAEGVEIDREFYLAVAMDRGRGVPVVIASAEGGMDIEQVAAKDPGAIVREAVSPLNRAGTVSGAKAGSGAGA